LEGRAQTGVGVAVCTGVVVNAIGVEVKVEVGL
jgi:hypothetical protein